LTTKVYFTPPKPTLPAGPTPTFEQQGELAFWASVKDSRNPAVLQAYVDRFPNGMFAGLARLLIEQLRTEAERMTAVGAREADLKKAEEDRRVAEQLRTNAEHKAAEVKQAEELRKAQEEAQWAREALLAAEKDRETALKAAEEARRARDEARKAVESTTQQLKVGSLQGAEFTSENAMVEHERLARDLQTELKRVGCDPGTTDGKWGAKARAAFTEFAKRTNSPIALGTGEPSLAALEAVVAQKGRICPQVCGRDEVEQDGKCVALSAPQRPMQKVQNGAKGPARSPSAKTDPGKGGTCLDWMPTGMSCVDAGGRHCSQYGNRRTCSAP
jgi:hypothetical protein